VFVVWFQGELSEKLDSQITIKVNRGASSTLSMCKFVNVFFNFLHIFRWSHSCYLYRHIANIYHTHWSDGTHGCR